MIREKHHRLPDECYHGCVAASFTACLKNRPSFFVSLARFQLFTDMLIDSAKQFRCDVVVYLFMPDHCHILLQGRGDDSDVLAVMKSFKHRTGYWLSIHNPNVRWQKDFYDHILKKDENIERHVRYILNNPVREGITNDWMKYPFKGSTVHDFSEW